jgi:flagellar hook-length control protein FliK
VVRIKEVNLDIPAYQPMRAKSSGDGDAEKTFAPLFDSARLDAARGRKTHADRPVSPVRDRKNSARHADEDNSTPSDSVSPPEDRLQSQTAQPNVENQISETPVSNNISDTVENSQSTDAGSVAEGSVPPADSDGGDGNRLPANGQTEAVGKVTQAGSGLIEILPAAPAAQTTDESAAATPALNQNPIPNPAIQNTVKNTSAAGVETVLPADEQSRQAKSDTVQTPLNQADLDSILKNQPASPTKEAQAQASLDSTKQKSTDVNPASQAKKPVEDTVVQIQIDVSNADIDQPTAAASQPAGNDARLDAPGKSSQIPHQENRPVQQVAPGAPMTDQAASGDSGPDSRANTRARREGEWRTVTANIVKEADVSPAAVEVVKTVEQTATHSTANNNPSLIAPAAANLTIEKPADTSATLNVAATDKVSEADARQNIDTVIKAATAAVSRNNARIQIRLDPPDLGTLHIEIRQNAAGLQLNLQATTVRAQQLLNQNSHELRSALEAQGLPPVQIDVQLRQDLRGDSGQGSRDPSQSGNSQTGGQTPQQFDSFFSQQQPFRDGQASSQTGLDFDGEAAGDTIEADRSAAGPRNEDWREMQFTQVNVLI